MVGVGQGFARGGIGGGGRGLLQAQPILGNIIENKQTKNK